jgi:hypothetical protein
MTGTVGVIGVMAGKKPAKPMLFACTVFKAIAAGMSIPAGNYAMRVTR